MPSSSRCRPRGSRTPGLGSLARPVTDPTPPTASVLVPVLDEERHITAALQDMQAQDVDGGVEFLVIDGRSEDRTREIVERLAAEDPRIRLLDNPQRITPAALNIGLAAARGEYIVRMDAHTHYPPGYIREGIDRLRRGGADWVSGPQRPRPVGRVSRAVSFALDTPLGAGGAAFRRDLTEEIEVDSGFTGVWHRRTLERHGGWDEDWAINQDAELAARIVRGGGRIVCIPQMSAEYVPRDSLRGLARQYRRYGFYRAKTVSRHAEGFRRSHAIPPAIVLTLVGALVAPRPLRAAARVGSAVYAAGDLWAGTGIARRTGRPADALAVAAVLAIMHLSWGAGFCAGIARFGPGSRLRRG